MVLEMFLLFTNTLVALFWLAVKHAMRQSAVRHSDNVAQPVQLAMKEHGFNYGIQAHDNISE